MHVKVAIDSGIEIHVKLLCIMVALDWRISYNKMDFLPRILPLFNDLNVNLFYMRKTMLNTSFLLLYSTARNTLVCLGSHVYLTLLTTKMN